MVTLQGFIHRLKSQSHLVQHNKQYHRKVLLSSIHWNGYTTGVPTQAHVTNMLCKLPFSQESWCRVTSNSEHCMSNKILRSRLRTLNIIIFTFFYKINKGDLPFMYYCVFGVNFAISSQLPITRTFNMFKDGNRKRFELSGVRVIGRSKKIAGSKEKKSVFTTQ